MPVPLEQPSAVDLRQATEPLGVDQVGRPLELREVLLDPGVGELGEHLGAQRLKSRT
jgi:hypothetical protein